MPVSCLYSEGKAIKSINLKLDAKYAFSHAPSNLKNRLAGAEGDCRTGGSQVLCWDLQKTREGGFGTSNQSMDVGEGVGHKDVKMKGFRGFTRKRRPNRRAIQRFLRAEKNLLEWM